MKHIKVLDVITYKFISATLFSEPGPILVVCHVGMVSCCCRVAPIPSTTFTLEIIFQWGKFRQKFIFLLKYIHIEQYRQSKY